MDKHSKVDTAQRAGKKGRAGKASASAPPSKRASAPPPKRVSSPPPKRVSSPPPSLKHLVEDLWQHQRELEEQNRVLIETQRQLEASRDQYAHLYDASPVGYLTIDASSRIHQLNLTAARLLEVEERARLTGRLLTSYVARADAAVLLAHIGNAIQGQSVATVEVSLRSVDGADTVVRLESGPLQRSSRPSPFCLMAMIDVTQARKLQQEREHIERKLQETQRLESLGVLAGGIAHDFNNLLTAILGRASLGSLSPGAPAELLEHFQQIEVAAERAADLCKQMTSYSGKGEFISRPIDLLRLMRNEDSLLRSAIHHGARLDFDVPDQLPSVQGDATQLRQLLMNLVINASEACEHRAGVVTVRARLEQLSPAELANARLGAQLAPGQYVCLEVKDNGAGMDPSTLHKIFQPFFSTKFAGRGLGLAVVRGIVQRHGAALAVDSAIAVGTTFRCWLPLAIEQAAPAADPKVVERRPSRGGTILLVDDEDAVRNTAELMLKHLGFQVLPACSGEEALQLFAKHRKEIRAVLLDLSMPEMDGREVFRALHSKHPDLSVLLMSGFDRRDALRGFGRTQPKGFLQKPLRPDLLRTALSKLLVEETASDDDGLVDVSLTVASAAPTRDS